MRKVIFTLFLITFIGVSGATSAKKRYKVLGKLQNPVGTLNCTLLQRNDSTFIRLCDAEDKMMSEIALGIECKNMDFFRSLRYLSSSDVRSRREKYSCTHGKKSQRTNEGNTMTAHFANGDGMAMDIEIRLYNDGLCFRYNIPNKDGAMLDFTTEHTSYKIGDGDKRWLQKYVPHYEEDYPLQDKAEQGEWGYPALFEHQNSWMLITEADVNRMYCDTHLRNKEFNNIYKVTFPHQWEGNGVGDATPKWNEGWHSPWRVIIAGKLSTLVESTLVEDVSRPESNDDWSWVTPGRASWVYWAYNHGTKDYQICKRYVDLAIEMGWEYVLFDWEWDSMTNGGNLEDAVAYALEKGIKPWIWYNSGGPHNTVPATPRDRMLTHENRVEEFAKLKKMGIVGVKIDFFESDKQQMINYYLDILEDAAKARLMVNFHGATLPRGWSRTYPHLMSMEAVHGAEQYNNTPRMTEIGARLNCTLPFTRNIVGPMDYTPVAFTNSQHPHLTTNAHELALCVAFESGIQHFADRPEGFLTQRSEVKDLLSKVPADWDDVKLIDGAPGEYVVLARRKGKNWYLAGLNGTNESRDIEVDLSQLSKNIFSVDAFCDGATEEDIDFQHLTLSGKKTLKLMCRPRGGFVLKAYIQ